MKVLFLMIYYPNVEEASNLYTDLVQEFHDHGHEAYVVAPAKEGVDTALNKEKDINVLRVKTGKLFNVGAIRKGISNVLLPYQFKSAIKKHFHNKQFDLIIVPTPPITFAGVVRHFKKKWGSKVYLILRDIFPQNAKDLGMINNSLIFNYFRSKEKALYAISDEIGCMSDGNINYIKKHDPEVPHSKLHLLPNWQKALPYGELDISVKEKYGFKDKYLVIFGGNIGEPQKIENIISLAQAYKHKNDIVFLVIGKGTRSNALKQIVKEQNLTNLVVMDFIARDDYQELVKNADIGLISLSEKFTIPNIPSKTLSYYNARIPVLAAVDANTDYGQMLEDTNTGLWSVTGDLETYKKNFDTLYNDKELRLKMGQNGYDYMMTHLTSDGAYQTIMNRVATSKNV